MTAPTSGPAGDRPEGQVRGEDRTGDTDQPGGEDRPAAWEAALLQELGRALGPGDVPDGLLERAAALVELADLDGQLARLLDEAPAQLAGVRGAPEAASGLSFEVSDGGVAVELAVRASGTGFRLTGNVVGDGTPAPAAEPGPAGSSTPAGGRPVGDAWQVSCERPDGSRRTASADGLGRFTLDDLAPGRVRLRLAGAGRVPVTTEWFVL